MRKWVGLIAVVLMLVVMAGCASADKASAVNDARNGVVSLYEIVKTYDASGQLIGSVRIGDQTVKLTGVAGGTAFFVGKDKEVQYLVTCAHCVQDYNDYGLGQEVVINVGNQQFIRQVSLKVYFDSETSVEAYLVAIDSVKDIAVLRLEKPTNLRKPLKLRLPKDSMVGDTVYALGYPYTSSSSRDTIEVDSIQDMTVTTGSIARLLTNMNTGVREVQTDAEITHGNSGGPLIDKSGNVVGVVSNGTTFTSGEKAMYAINIAEVIDMLDRYKVDYILVTDFPVLLVVILGVVIVVLVVLIVVLVVKKGGKVSSDRYLVCEAGALAGQSFPLKRGQRVTIGRSPDCQIRFPGNTAGVSKLHCSVVYDGEKVLIRDENSTAGTFIDGNKLTPGTAVTLHRGHPVGLGSKAQILVLRSKK